MIGCGKSSVNYSTLKTQKEEGVANDVPNVLQDLTPLDQFIVGLTPNAPITSRQCSIGRIVPKNVDSAYDKDAVYDRQSNAMKFKRSSPLFKPRVSKKWIKLYLRREPIVSSKLPNTKEPSSETKVKEWLSSQFIM